MRAVTVAAVQVAPSHGPLTAGSVAANCGHAVDLVRECVATTGAELVVLPRRNHVTTLSARGFKAAALPFLAGA